MDLIVQVYFNCEKLSSQHRIFIVLNKFLVLSESYSVFESQACLDVSYNGKFQSPYKISSPLKIRCLCRRRCAAPPASKPALLGATYDWLYYWKYYKVTNVVPELPNADFTLYPRLGDADRKSGGTMMSVWIRSFERWCLMCCMTIRSSHCLRWKRLELWI